jgi:cobalt-zinc-cadmium efflux system outer membrane protein
MFNEILLALSLAAVPAGSPAPGPRQGRDAAARPEANGQAVEPARVTIEEAVREGLARNHDLRTERERLGIADARRTTAGLRPNPLLSASADHLDVLGTGFDEVNGGGPAEYVFRADYDWQLGGKRGRRIEVAERERDLVRREVADRTRRLAFDIQSGFVDLLLTQQTLALSRENLGAFRRVADISAARVKSGDLAEVELMRTRVALVQLENAVHRAELARRLSQNRLQMLLGRPAAAAPSLEAVGGFRLAAAVPSAEALVEAALERRPDLQAAEADAARSRAELDLQRALARADLTFGAEYRRQEGVNGKSNSMGFFLSAPLPVFDRNQGEVARARIEGRQADLRIQAARAAIESEVRDAWDQHRVASLLVDRMERELLADAREVRSVTEYAYQRGEARLIELLDAERAFNEAMEGYLGAQAELARSLYLLDAVSGKGGQP